MDKYVDNDAGSIVSNNEEDEEDDDDNVHANVGAFLGRHTPCAAGEQRPVIHLQFNRIGNSIDAYHEDGLLMPSSRAVATSITTVTSPRKSGFSRSSTSRFASQFRVDCTVEHISVRFRRDREVEGGFGRWKHIMIPISGAMSVLAATCHLTDRYRLTHQTTCCLALYIVVVLMPPIKHDVHVQFTTHRDRRQ